jgi:hypothetical protein
MFICKDDVVKILDTMNKFPEASSFYLAKDLSSGIGTVITLTIATTINQVAGSFTVEISGVENW